MAGAVADFRLDYGRSLSKTAKIVCINRSKADLKLNSDLFWSPAISSCSDPGLVHITQGAARYHQCC